MNRETVEAQLREKTQNDFTHGKRILELEKKLKESNRLRDQYKMDLDESKEERSVVEEKYLSLQKRYYENIGSGSSGSSSVGVGGGGSRGSSTYSGVSPNSFVGVVVTPSENIDDIVISANSPVSRNTLFRYIEEKDVKIQILEKKAKKIPSLILKNQQYRNEVAGMRSKVEKYDGIRSKCSTLERQLRHMQGIRSKNAELTSQMDEIVKQKAEKEEMLGSMKVTFKTEMGKLNNEIKKISGEIDTKNEEIETWKKTCQGQNTLLMKMEKKRQRLTKENAVLRDNKSELERSVVRLQGGEREEELRIKIEKLEGQVGVLETENSELRTGRNGIEEQSAIEKQKVDEMISKLMKDKSGMEIELEKLREKANEDELEVENLLRACEEKGAEVEQLKLELSTSEENVKNGALELDETVNRLQSLETKYEKHLELTRIQQEDREEQQKQILQSLEGLVHEKGEHVQELKNQIIKMSEEHAIALREQKRELVEKETSLREMNDQISLLMNEKSESRMEMRFKDDSFEKERDEFRRNVEQYESSISGLENQVVEKVERLKQLEAQAVESKRVEEESLRRMSEMERRHAVEVGNLREIISSKDLVVEGKDERIEEVENRLKTMEQEGKTYLEKMKMGFNEKMKAKSEDFERGKQELLAHQKELLGEKDKQFEEMKSNYVEQLEEKNNILKQQKEIIEQKEQYNMNQLKLMEKQIAAGEAREKTIQELKNEISNIIEQNKVQTNEFSTALKSQKEVFENQLEEKVGEYRSKLELKQKEIERLEAERIMISKNIVSLEEKIALFQQSSQKEGKAVQLQIEKALEESRRRQSEEIRSYQEKMREKEHEIGKLVENVAALKSEIGVQSNRHKEELILRENEKSDVLRKQQKDLMDAHEKLVATKDLEIGELKTRLKEMEDTLSQSRELIEQKELSQKKFLEEQRLSHEKMAQELRTELSSINEQNKTQVNEFLETLKSQKQMFEMQKNEHDSLLEETKASVREKEKEIEDMLKEKGVITERINSLEEQVRQSEGNKSEEAKELQKRADDSRNEAEKLKEDLARLKEVLGEKDSQVEEMKIQLSELLQKNSELRLTEARVDELTDQLLKSEEGLKESEQVVLELKLKTNSLSEKVERLGLENSQLIEEKDQILQNQSELLSEKIEETKSLLQTQIEEKVKLIRQQREEIEKKEKFNLDQQKLLAVQASTGQQQEKTIGEMKTQLLSINEYNKLQADELSGTLKSQVKESELRVEELTKALESKARDLDAVEEERDVLRKRVEELESHFKESEKRVEELTNELDSKVKDVEILNEEGSVLRKQVEDLGSLKSLVKESELRGEELTKALESRVKDFEVVNGEKNGLIKQVKELGEKLKEGSGLIDELRKMQVENEKRYNSEVQNLREDLSNKEMVINEKNARIEEMRSQGTKLAEVNKEILLGKGKEHASVVEKMLSEQSKHSVELINTKDGQILELKTRFESQVEGLKTKIQEMEKENILKRSELEAELNRKQEEVENCNSKTCDLQLKIATLDETNSKTREELAEKNGIIRLLEQSVAEGKRLEEDHENRLSEVNERHKAELENMREVLASKDVLIEGKVQQVEEMREKMNVMSEKHEVALKEKDHSAVSLAKDHEKSLEGLKTELINHHNELITAKGEQVEDLKSQIDLFKSQLLEKETMLDQQKALIEKKDSSQQELIEKQLLASEAHEKIVQELRDELSSMNEQNKIQVSELANALKSQKEILNGKLKECEEMRSEIRIKREESECLLVEKNELAKSVAILEEKMAKLSERVVEVSDSKEVEIKKVVEIAEKSMGEVNARHGTEIENLNEVIAGKDSLIEEKTERLEETKAQFLLQDEGHKRMLKEKSDAITSLENDNSMIKEEIERLKTELEARDFRILEVRRESLEKENEKTAEITELFNKFQELELDQQKLERSFEEQRQELETSFHVEINESRELQQKIDTLESKLRVEIENSKNLEQSKEIEFNESIDFKEREIMDLRRELNEKDFSNSELLERELSVKDQTVFELEKRLMQVEPMCINLEERCEYLERVKKNSQNKISELNATILQQEFDLEKLKKFENRAKENFRKLKTNHPLIKVMEKELLFLKKENSVLRNSKNSKMTDFINRLNDDFEKIQDIYSNMMEFSQKTASTPVKNLSKEPTLELSADELGFSPIPKKKRFRQKRKIRQIESIE